MRGDTHAYSPPWGNAFTWSEIEKGTFRFDKSRNDHINVTFHDSCNPARGMGIFEEPRYVIQSVCNNFVEMPDNNAMDRSGLGRRVGP